ncbi:unnamed protein product [Scytosiphon promiscuus]
MALNLGRATQIGKGKARLARLAEDFAKRDPVHATLKGLVHHGRHASSKFVAHHLRDQQLCVRLSQQMRRLELFPRPAGSKAHHLDQLLRVHSDTFQELHDVKGVVDRMVHGSRADSLQQQRCHPLDDFRRCVDAVNNRHATNVETLMEAKRDAGLPQGTVGGDAAEREHRLQLLIDDFLTVHISFQLLCRHYLQSLKPADLENSNARTGLVAERCLLSDVIADAVGETQLITEHHLVHSPDVIIEGDVDARASCIPSHVHHILFEVLKNSLRATAMAHNDVADALPPVRVRISQGSRQVSVCVSDEGGGMSMGTARDAFRYLWTSSEAHETAQAKHAANASFQPSIDPLSGMGIGLPVSRLYARHFGGDLQMLSLQGFGTHVGLFLPLASDGVERLPSSPVVPAAVHAPPDENFLPLS